VVDFLVEQFDKGYQSSTLNGFRSAISSTAPWWNGVPVGQSELVKKCMANIDLQRPSKPAYSETWDLDVLITWLESLPKNKDLSLEQLRMKCIVLIKIITLARSSDVDYISFHSIRLENDTLYGSFNPPKNYKKGCPSDFKIKRFEDNEDLCTFAAWEEYFNRTKEHRTGGDKVFLNILPPYDPIGVQRIAKITLEAMEMAGIDVTRFKAHSTRMAVASKAIDRGASVDEVMRQGRWRSRDVFTTFYNRSHPMDISGLLFG
jgi:hypothetical protein